MENFIFRLTLHIYTCPLTTSYIFSHWLAGVLIERLLVKTLMLSICPHTGMSTFEELTIMRLLKSQFLSLVLWLIHRLAQLSSLCISIHIMERGVPFIPMCSFSGIRMMWMKNQGRWMVVNNGSSPMMDTFPSSVFTKTVISSYRPYYSMPTLSAPELLWSYLSYS